MFVCRSAKYQATFDATVDQEHGAQKVVTRYLNAIHEKHLSDAVDMVKDSRYLLMEKNKFESISSTVIELILITWLLIGIIYM